MVRSTNAPYFFCIPNRSPTTRRNSACTCSGLPEASITTQRCGSAWIRRSVPGAHALVEGQVKGVQAVPLAALGAPAQPFLHIQIQEDGQVGLQPAGGKIHQRL